MVGVGSVSSVCRLSVRCRLVVNLRRSSPDPYLPLPDPTLLFGAVIRMQSHVLA